MCVWSLECPQNLGSCKCLNEGLRVECAGTTVKELGLNQLPDIQFPALFISSTDISIIDDNALGKASFEEIWIQSNTKLTKISKNAFNKGPNKLVIESNINLDPGSLWALIKNLISLQEIVLTLNNIKELPSDAFKLNNSSETSQLNTLVLTHNKIETIASNAFIGLPELNYINLEGNSIKQVADNGFSFSIGPNNNEFIFINLYNNQLVENSFSANSFENENRVKIKLLLSQNPILSLSETVFGQLMNNGLSQINVAGINFQCDSCMKWLLNDKIRSNVLSEVTCSNFAGKSIFSVNESELKSCQSSVPTKIPTSSTIFSTLSTTTTKPPTATTKTTVYSSSTTQLTTPKINDRCPNSQLISPCECDSTTLSISCASIGDDELIKIGPHLIGSFRSLSIHDTRISSIEKDIFIDSNFDSIRIEFNTFLQMIDPEAFSNSTTSSFTLRNNIHFADKNVFQLIKNLNPSKIDLSGNALREIPANAFYSTNSDKIRLQSIILDYNKLENIGSNSFYGLMQLNQLSLNHNSISMIADNGLRFSSSSTPRQLFVSLNNNRLKTTSFTARSIQAVANVSISLHLENNQLESINENVFKSFINEMNNDLDFNGNHFVCDCSMKWILNFSLRNNILNVDCSDRGKSIFELKESEFQC